MTPHLGALGLAAIAVAVAVLAPDLAARQSHAGATFLDGARLIVGDGSPPIERGALVVENGRLAAVGRVGTVKAPAGARRIDFAGKTIMPALVDGHVHLGY